jgi:hypothetical protein
MLPSLTLVARMRRLGLDAGFWGQAPKPPSEYAPLRESYLAGYALGRQQRIDEIEAGTHPSLFGGVKYKPHRHYPVRRKTG